MQHLETDIPIPPKVPAGAPDKYPYRTIKVGESFLVHRATQFSTQPWQKKTGFSYSIRRVTENGVDAWRCWRTA